jgi:O-antigen/teichoic acid export membrane protein
MQAANRVAINTAIQYVQLVANILIGLISVRLILGALGDIDYGIYDVVGGLIALLAFISNSLAQSSMRFLSVSLGTKDNLETKRVFRSCIWLHFLIALGLAFLIELIGIFVFNGFLNIPANRLSAAKIIYHCVTISLFLNILSSPFSALIISHEHFWYTSLVALLNSVLKLIIAVLLTYCFSDKLIAYGILLSIVTLLDFILLCLFTLIKYPHQISLSFPGIHSLKSITSFVGWTLLDVLGSLLNRQGYAILLNRFFGPVTNTSFALSRQLEGHMFSVSSSVISTMKPQMMKSYGAGEEKRMFRLALTAGKIGFALMALIGIPLIIMMPEVLHYWLKEYPADTILFARLMIIACMIEQLTRGLVYANQAVGNIKWFSMIVSSIRIVALPLSWVLLRFGCPSYVAIVVFLICETIASLSRIVILGRISTFNPSDFIRLVLFKIFTPVMIGVFICLLMYHLFPRMLVYLLINILITTCFYGYFVYQWGLTVGERDSVKGIVISFLHRLRFVSDK